MTELDYNAVEVQPKCCCCRRRIYECSGGRGHDKTDLSMHAVEVHLALSPGNDVTICAGIT